MSNLVNRNKNEALESSVVKAKVEADKQFRFLSAFGSFRTYLDLMNFFL